MASARSMSGASASSCARSTASCSSAATGDAGSTDVSTDASTRSYGIVTITGTRSLAAMA
ncbi:hypothetical protein ACFPRL_09680 [Pseudoclavibacter helvolus]